MHDVNLTDKTPDKPSDKTPDTPKSKPGTSVDIRGTLQKNFTMERFWNKMMYYVPIANNLMFLFNLAVLAHAFASSDCRRYSFISIFTFAFVLMGVVLLTLLGVIFKRFLPRTQA